MRYRVIRFMLSFFIQPTDRSGPWVRPFSCYVQAGVHSGSFRAAHCRCAYGVLIRACPHHSYVTVERHAGRIQYPAAAVPA